MIDDNTKEELKAYLPQYVEQITYKTKGGLYKCPVCPSGTGKHRTGAFSIFDNGKAWQCMSCKAAGDIFKLIELYEHKPNFSDQVARAAEFAGMVPDLERVPVKSNDKESKERPMRGMGIYKEYIEKCSAAASKTDYFKSRGFGEETVKRFNLGYDEIKKAIVIPYGIDGNYYITRDTATKANDGNHQFRKPKREEAGEEPLFNKEALYKKDPCFVCESPIDAISVIETGGGLCDAIAIGGTGQAKLIKELTERKPECILILSFDEDKPGKSTTERTEAELNNIGIDYIIAEYSLDKYPAEARKDANDFLRGNSEQFKEDIKNNIERAAKATRESKEKRERELEENAASKYVESLFSTENITKPVKTGFKKFDEEIGGGLYPGLYILGAISSIGKTTLVVQIADQIAASGKDVLFYTLEMGIREIISRSLARESYIEAGKIDAGAVTSRSIMSGSIYNNCQQANLERAKNKFAAGAGKHLYYFESIGEIGISEIRKQAEKYLDIRGSAPVIFIDYLQILKPYNESWTDKRNIDKAVTELRKMARDLKTPIFAISSLNRGSYSGDIDASAFKESGAIEYGSDVLLGLQALDLGYGEDSKDVKANKEKIDRTKKQAVRDLEIKVIKNRNGSTQQRISLRTNAKFSYFEEIEKIDIPGYIYNGVADVF